MASSNNFYAGHCDSPKSKSSHSTPKYNDKQFYSISTTKGGKIGQGIIIVNEKFDDKPGFKRNGADKDMKNFKAIFDKFQIGYTSHSDLKASKMWKELESFAQECIENRPSRIVVAISSHGRCMGDIIGKDHVIISLRHIFNFFDRPVLSTTPKLFLIQACRGSGSERMIIDTSHKISTEIRETSSIASTMSNTLIAYATGEGYYSWRDKVNGSWFIQVLRFCIEHPPYKDMHLVEVLTICIDLVIKMACSDNTNKIETPCYQSTLTKLLKFTE